VAHSAAPIQRYIAFLRAINVGGHTVKMNQLRELFAAIELANVETFIASGNVIFDSPKADAQALERQIESHLLQALGYAVATFLRTPAEVAAVARYQPFAPDEHADESNWLYVAFLPAPPADAAAQKLLALRTPLDDFHVHGREFYWLRRRALGESTFAAGLFEKTLGLPATMRNITTVKKLATKYPGD
jgi:uncharacterized protein (DUF1697 family)